MWEWEIECVVKLRPPQSKHHFSNRRLYSRPAVSNIAHLPLIDPESNSATHSIESTTRISNGASTVLWIHLDNSESVLSATIHTVVVRV
jgi:hypothetical protein